jgi:hypothetical protein
MKKVKKVVKAKAVKDNGKSLYRMLVWALVLIAAFILLAKSDSRLSPIKEPKVSQSSIQLIGPNGELNGFGTALKSSNKGGFELNVTAFLEDPQKDKCYYVLLTEGGEGYEDLFAGKMSKSGDVYSLNFTSSSDHYTYRQIVVFSASEAEMQEGAGAIVLTGTFPE